MRFHNFSARDDLISFVCHRSPYQVIGINWVLIIIRGHTNVLFYKFWNPSQELPDNNSPHCSVARIDALFLGQITQCVAWKFKLSDLVNTTTSYILHLVIWSLPYPTSWQGGTISVKGFWYSVIFSQQFMWPLQCVKLIGFPSILRQQATANSVFCLYTKTLRSILAGGRLTSQDSKSAYFYFSNLHRHRRQNAHNHLSPLLNSGVTSVSPRSSSVPVWLIRFCSRHWGMISQKRVWHLKSKPEPIFEAPLRDLYWSLDTRP